MGIVIAYIKYRNIKERRVKGQNNRTEYINAE